MFIGLRSCCFLICVLMVSSARAGVILSIDLRTVNQVTIAATTGVSLATKSGNDVTGVYLKDFFGTNVFSTAGSTLLPGADLVYFNATSDGSLSLFRSGSVDPGLNIYSLDNNTPSASFTTGVQAFKGSATWSLTPSQYSVLLMAPKTGDVYAFADDISDLNGGPQVIGQYGDISAVPEPTSMAIFGLGGLGMAYLARRKRTV